jgi:PAS domain S-box-containing protein
MGNPLLADLDDLCELIGADTLDPAGTAIARIARRALGCDGVGVVLHEGAECHHAWEDTPSVLWQGRRFPAATCAAGVAVAAGHSIVVEDVRHEPPSFPELSEPTFVRGLAVVPGGRPADVALGAYWAAPHLATAQELEALRRLAQALSRARGHVNLRSTLEESERRFRIMADLSPLMIWVHDEAGRMEYVNRAWLRFFGASETDATGDDWQPLIHPADRDAYVSEFLRAVEARTEFRAACRVRAGSGEWRWIESYGAPRRDASGAFRGIVGSSADVTELRQLTEKLRVEGQRKEHWIAQVSHELRQPVNVMRMALPLASLPDPATASRFREMLERQVRQMTRLLDDLLDTAKVARGQVTLKIEPVDLVTVVGELAEEVAAGLREQQLELQVSTPPTPVPASADRVRTRQILQNLIQNAAKFSPAGRVVQVTVREAGALQEICVVDEGEGIDPQVIDGIFELFSTSGVDSGGFGIGLFVARNLARSMGGDLTATSDGKGLGSRFVLTLPAGKLQP